MSNWCTICDSERQGNFCYECGQCIKTRKASLPTVFGELISSVFSLERSMPVAIFKVVKDPSEIIKNYWAGFRRYYPGPGKFLLYSLTVALIHLLFVNDDLLGLSFDVENTTPQLAFWVIFFPLLVMCSYISFFRIDRNFTKHLISSLYISSSTFIILLILSDLINWLTPLEIEGIQFILFLLSTFILNSALFSRKKTFLFHLLNIIIQTLVFALLIASIVA